MPRGSSLPGVIFFACLLLASPPLPAQNPPAAPQQALQAVKASLEAHGGTTAEEGLRISLTLRSDFVSEGQSVVAEAPFERYPNRIEMRVDRPGGRSVVRLESAIAGDFQFGERVAVQNGKGFSLNPAMKTYREVTEVPGFLNRYFPHRLLQQALQDPAALQWVGEEGGLDVVSVTPANGPATTLYLDRATRLLRKTEQKGSMGGGLAGAAVGPGFRIFSLCRRMGA